MSIQARQTTQQRLLLAPNITLALEVLRMAAMELQTFLQQQTEENPLLELSETPQESSEEEPGTNSQESAGNTPEGDPPEDAWELLWANGGSEDEPVDEDRAERRQLEHRLSKPQSLSDSLRLQLGCYPMAAENRRIGEAIILQVDDDGYLGGSMDELAASLGVDRKRVEAVLAIIQRFDPPGVGGRDLRECLLLQLGPSESSEHSPIAPRDALARRILEDHFHLFIERRLSAIAKTTARSLQEVEEAFERLKQLNPKPGRSFSNDLPPSIIPDLLIVKREQHYDVELNDQGMPQVTVSRGYYRMLRDPKTPEEARAFLANKFRQASWIIRAIDERNATLLAIGRCLISLQREFVEQGVSALKPLTQAQVAGLIGRHPSTVSRAIAGKTIDTPYGIFRLEQLFTSSVPQQDDQHLSDARIKSEIQQLITEEDLEHPLSDETLVQRLAQRHISVARRTVAKYRTSLKILPAYLRKRSF